MPAIHKAVVPLAGRGTRLAPLTSAMPKALFPLVDPSGRVRPVIHYIATQAAAAGAQQLMLVVSPWQRELIERYFEAARQSDPAELPQRIEYAIQDKPLGFGDAVDRAASFVGKDAFLLMLGDHVHVASASDQPCAAQVADAFARTGGAAMVGMHLVGEQELHLVGAAAGRRVSARIFQCTAFIEKPTPTQARLSLVSPDLPPGEYLAHAGIYIFTPEIFECLGFLRSATKRGGELQLSDAQSLLLQRHPQDYYLYHIAGAALDTGTPEKYAHTLDAFRRA